MVICRAPSSRLYTDTLVWLQLPVSPYQDPLCPEGGHGAHCSLMPDCQAPGSAKGLSRFCSCPAISHQWPEHEGRPPPFLAVPGTDCQALYPSINHTGKPQDLN